MDNTVGAKDEQESGKYFDYLFTKHKADQLTTLELDGFVDALEEADEHDIPVLIAYTRDEDKNVRAWAAYALGWTNDKRALEGLLPLLATKDTRLLYNAIQAISHLGYGDERGLLPLLAALEDEDSDIRLMAANALGLFDDERVIQALTKIRTADVPRVEEAAKSSLGRIKFNRWAK